MSFKISIRLLSAILPGVLAALFFSGCALLQAPPEEQPYARQALERLKADSEGLVRFKGLGSARMQTDGQPLSGRIALAAASPDKMRVEWLNMLGQPLISMVADGKAVTIFRYSDRKVYHLRQSSTALEKVLHIPIDIGALFKILSGGFPVPPDTVVQLDHGAANANLLIFKNRWRHTLETISVDRQSDRIRSMTTFDGHGNVRYKVEWLRWQHSGAFVVPLSLVVESGAGQRLELTLDRFWPNADIAPGTFRMDLTEDAARHPG